MRILFVSNFFPPSDLGGMEQLCQEVVEQMRDRGHTCHVLTSRYGADGSTQPELNVTRSLYLQADIHYYQPLDYFLRRPMQEQANLRALRALLDSFRPDVVFMWGMWNLSRVIAYWAEQWLPGRTAYYIASYWLIEPDSHEAYWQQQARRPWARVLMAPIRALAQNQLERARESHPLVLRHVACVSNYVYQKLITSDVLPNGGEIIYNGIDVRPFMQASGPTKHPEKLRLIYTGGILPHKGVHTAIEALGRLKQRGEVDGVHLVLVGSGHPDYESYLRQKVIELNLCQHVVFQGRVPRSEIPAILVQNDVFLFPSVWEEPIARTVMEAMASGLPVIGTTSGGQREMLIDGVNALVFPPDDPIRLMECILQLRDDFDLRFRLGEAGRQVVQNRFSLERMTENIETWLASIVKEGSRDQTTNPR